MTQDIAQIRRLERGAALLEPDSAARAQLLADVHAHAERFLEEIGERPAFIQTETKGSGLYDAPFADDPRPVAKVLELLDREVDRPGLNAASGGHLGYIPGGGIYTSALADYLAAVTNKFSGVFFPGPGAVRMENMLLDWMRELVGYPAESAAGNITSGGSIANLMAIVAARDDAGLKGKDFEHSVVYTSEQAHHSLPKALRIAGLGECLTRLIPLDDGYRMKADALADRVHADRSAGLRPFLVIAAAGTTDTGVVDPIEDIAAICEAHQLWFHVDAAYGGFFRLCETGREIVTGLERSSSVIMDPHKTLFVPYGAGMLLVRDRTTLLESHHYTANYLQDAKRAQDELSPADLSPELSKHFRGLRIWMPFLLHGLRPFRDALEEKLLLARYFHEQLCRVDGFEVGPYPDLSVVTFRYVPDAGDPNLFNEQLVRAVQDDGQVFISSTVLDGTFTLRLAVSSFRTHLDTVDLALQILADTARRLTS